MIINFQYVERQLREEKMEIRQNWSPVKLKAVDDQDLQVFSQCLFESIVLPSEINFEKKNNGLQWQLKDSHGNMLKMKVIY